MDRVGRLLGCLASLLVGGGCIHLSPHCEHAARQPMPPALAEKLARSPRETVRSEESRREIRSGHWVNWIELHVTTPLRATNFTVTCEYHPVAAAHAPVVLIMPMAGGSYPVERYFARYFNRHGFAAVIQHRRRFPHESTLEEINPWIVASVQDSQRILDWIHTRPELDAERLAIFGISTGGLKGTLLTALDPRVKAAALGLAGSDLPYILTHTSEPKIVRLRDRLMREKEMTAPQLEAHLREVIQWDPGQMGGCIDSERVLLVLARYDRVIPFRKGWELRDKLGRPETLLLPTGHYTAALGIPFIEMQSLRFFERKLEVEPVRLERARSPKDTGP